jgi:hypothetical protein
MRQDLSALALLAGLASVMGCAADDLYDWQPQAGDVHTLKNGIAVHETGRDAIYYLDARIDKPSLKRLFAPDEDERIVWSAPGPEAEAPTQLFVMTAPADERNTTLDERLFRVTTDGRAPTAFKVGTPFDQITFGPEGRYAILYHGARDESAPGLYNANEVALIDLTRKPSADNPRRLNVSIDGRRIDMVSFVPSLTVGGLERRLMVFMGGGVVRVVDLDDPEGNWVKVPLLPKDDPREITPQELISLDETPGCEDASCEAKLFIRASGTQDVYYITLGRSPDSFEGTQSKQLEAGGYSLDMELVRDGDATLLVVLSSSNAGSKINVIDIDTGAPFSMMVEDRLSSLLLQEGDPSDKLVLYGSGAGGVHFLQIDGLTEEKGRNLSKLAVQGGVSSVAVLDQSRLLIIPGSGGLMLLDLVTEKAIPLSTTSIWPRAGRALSCSTTTPSPCTSSPGGRPA